MARLSRMEKQAIRYGEANPDAAYVNISHAAQGSLERIGHLSRVMNRHHWLCIGIQAKAARAARDAATVPARQNGYRAEFV